MALDPTSIPTAIGAIGALGTASFGLVDATKAFWGGISRCGIRNIRNAIKPLFDLGEPSAPAAASPAFNSSNALSYGGILANLRANWMNGTALADQKAIAKALLKLRLNAANAERYAAATGVDGKELAAIASQINLGAALTTPQADVFGRFDLGLTALLDEGYQRADQRYRNSAKVLAGAFAVGIAVYGGWYWSYSTHAAQHVSYFFTGDMWTAVIVGLLATPLAPIAKDLTSALAAGVDVMQKVKK